MFHVFQISPQQLLFFVHGARQRPKITIIQLFDSFLLTIHLGVLHTI